MVIGIGALLFATRERRAFHRAVKSGDMNVVGEMLGDDPKLVNTRAWFNHTPLLFYAVDRADMAMIELLLSNRANPNGDVGAFRCEETPLGCAAAVGRTEIVRLLLAAGADVNRRTFHQLKTPLHHAAEWGHVETVEVLLAAGADVNARSEFGDRSPLDEAATDDIRAMLRKHGAR